MGKKRTEIKTIPADHLKINANKYQVWGVMSEEKYEQFFNDVKTNGIRDLIHVDEEYTVLDGHHRYQAVKELGIKEVAVKVYYGLTEEEKLEIAHKSNSLRNEIPREKKIERAIELRKEGRSYPQIAEWLGVGKSTIERWVKQFATFPGGKVAKVESSDGKLRPAEMPSDDELTERRKKVKALLDEGKKVADIAQEVGKSESTIYNDIKANQKEEIDEDKQKRREKNKQKLDVAAYEVKTLEDLYPDYIEDEPEYSDNNVVINARKRATMLAINSAFIYDSLKNCNENVKRAYVRQAKILANSLLISVGAYCGNKEYEEIVFVILELLEKINLEEDIFNE